LDRVLGWWEKKNSAFPNPSRCAQFHSASAGGQRSAGEPPAIVTNIRKKQLKLPRAERTTEQYDNPKATAPVTRLRRAS